MPQKKLNIIYHLIGIIVFLSVPVLFSPDFSSDMHFLKVDGFQEDFFFHCILLLFFYVNYLYLVPKFYFNKKYFTFAMILVGLLLVIFLVPSFLLHHGGHHHEMQNGIRDVLEDFNHNNRGDGDGQNNNHRFEIFNELKRVFQYLLIVLIGIVLQINKRLKQAESEKVTTELAYLKSQINPHFLFNTLNSIYSLAIVGSTNTANAIVMLSNMMRYVLNDASKDWVNLDDELNYISNYIELQRIRFEESVDIDYTIEGDTDGKIVAPLLLIPFIENAFQYGVNAEQNSLIKIEINIKKTMMHVSIWNKKVDYSKSTFDSHGIGIENTKSRLNLLYPNRHILSIQDDVDNYNVSLILHFV